MKISNTGGLSNSLEEYQKKISRKEIREGLIKLKDNIEQDIKDLEEAGR